MCRTCVFFFFKQKTAYEMRISDWSSDVCSSDLASSSPGRWRTASSRQPNSTTCRCRRSWSARSSSTGPPSSNPPGNRRKSPPLQGEGWVGMGFPSAASRPSADKTHPHPGLPLEGEGRSEEHTSELQSLMRISYAVFCLKKKKQTDQPK